MGVYSYRFSLLLLLSIVLGGVTAYIWGPHAVMLKPLGDIFLNLLYTIIVPLIFFSVSSAIVGIEELKRLRKIFSTMFGVFLITGGVAAIFMMGLVILFPLTKNVALTLNHPVLTHTIDIGSEITRMLTVPNLADLFQPNNMLALIFIAILVGLATSLSGEKAKPFAQFLEAGAQVFMTLISFVMYYAPIGFFAFFAVLVSKLGPVLFESYFRTTIIYYAGGIIYFIAAFTLFAFLADKKTGVKKFWKNAMPPAMTALATCSSAASIPVNMIAAKNMGIADDIYETVIPLGTVIHKQGSILGGVVKIAFLYGIFHMNFFTPFALGSTWIVAILVGTVMGAIPSGGMLGEMLILSVYGFPPQALFIIATISIIIDPLATALNVVGNTVACQLVARFTTQRHSAEAMDQGVE